MQELYICDHCGEEFPLEETLLVERDRLCRHCAAGLTALCDECGARIYLEHDEGDSNRFLCASCRERYYTRCDRCNTLIYNENVYEYDGENLCEDCYDEVCTEGPIHEYDYVPDLVFHGKGLRKFGVELEIDEGGKSRSNANRLLEIANRDAVNLYIKSDGSLDDGPVSYTHLMLLKLLPIRFR